MFVVTLNRHIVACIYRYTDGISHRKTKSPRVPFLSVHISSLRSAVGEMHAQLAVRVEVMPRPNRSGTRHIVVLLHRQHCSTSGVVLMQQLV